jgi:hypothetical protein
MERKTLKDEVLDLESSFPTGKSLIRMHSISCGSPRSELRRAKHQSTLPSSSNLSPVKHRNRTLSVDEGLSNLFVTFYSKKLEKAKVEVNQELETFLHDIEALCYSRNGDNNQGLKLTNSSENVSSLSYIDSIDIEEWSSGHAFEDSRFVIKLKQLRDCARTLLVSNIKELSTGGVCRKALFTIMEMKHCLDRQVQQSHIITTLKKYITRLLLIVSRFSRILSVLVRSICFLNL